jgi:hypothetical protein
LFILHKSEDSVNLVILQVVVFIKNATPKTLVVVCLSSI